MEEDIIISQFSSNYRSTMYTSKTHAFPFYFLEKKTISHNRVKTTEIVLLSYQFLKEPSSVTEAPIKNIIRNDVL